MASCGSPPPPAAATPAAAAAAATAAAARAAATLGAAAMHRVTLLQHPLSSKDNAYCGGGFPSYNSSSSLTPGSTSTQMKRRCNFRSEDLPCLGPLHEVARAVPSAGRIRARASCGLRRRDGKECRLYTHNGTKALIRHLHQASYYIILPR